MNRGAPWAVARWLLLAALLAFLTVGDAPERTRFWTALFEFGHAPLFGVIALVVRGLLAARLPEGRAHPSLRAFVAVVLLGAVTELLQLGQPWPDAAFQDVADRWPQSPLADETARQLRERQIASYRRRGYSPERVARRLRPGRRESSS